MVFVIKHVMNCMNHLNFININQLFFTLYVFSVAIKNVNQVDIRSTIMFIFASQLMKASIIKTNTIKSNNDRFSQIIFVDTPNLIFSKRFIVKSIIEAIIAFILKNPKTLFILLITPRIRNRYPNVVEILRNLEEQWNNVLLVNSPKHTDPDLCLLYYAHILAKTSHHVYILSNDRYRSKIYQSFLSNLKLLPFRLSNTSHGCVIDTELNRKEDAVA